LCDRLDCRDLRGGEAAGAQLAGIKGHDLGGRQKHCSGEILEPANHGVTRFRGQLLVGNRPHQGFIGLPGGLGVMTTGTDKVD
jgi:hypothetical protein